MTCREKLALDNPQLSEAGIDCLIREGCPHHYGYLEMPAYCIYNGPMKCVRCWDREIPEEDEVTKNDISEPTIKDSGDRTEFSSGAVRDMHTGKGRMDLLPWAAIMEVSKHCENGAKKYGEHNVDRGIPTNSLCDSAARHLAKYLDGWTDEPHLTAAAWNLLWAIQMEVKNKEMVNTPWQKRADDIIDTNQGCDSAN